MYMQKYLTSPQLHYLNQGNCKVQNCCLATSYYQVANEADTVTNHVQLGADKALSGLLVPLASTAVHQGSVWAALESFG